MRRALVVGIDHYQEVPCLRGCVRDAISVSNVLATNSSGNRNFGVHLMTSRSTKSTVTKASLWEQLQGLFAEKKNDIALFYFAGYGRIETTGGFLVTGESHGFDEGVPMQDLIDIANHSPARSKVIVLDCCHPRSAGVRLPSPSTTEKLGEGLTILAASTAEQYAEEGNDAGVFTSLFVDALEGAAANLVGDVTLGSVYAHIDQSLGEWDQRPVFKANVRKFVSLREVEPPISSEDLRRLTEFFPEPDHEFKLSPSFEPQSRRPNPEKTLRFGILQKYNRVNLVVPVGAPHMYYAAMLSTSCKLTRLGKHYWRLVAEGMI